MWNFKTNRLQRQTLYAALILAILSVIMVVTLRHAEAQRPDVVLYSSEFQMPVNRGALIDRIIPRNWVWAWKLRDKIRGKVKAVEIEGLCFETPLTADFAVRTLGLKGPTIERDGTRIWLLLKDESNRMRKGLFQMPITRLLDTGRISTGDNMAASLFSGNSLSWPNNTTRYGFGLQTLPRISDEKIDLTSVFTYSEPCTNNVSSENTPQSLTITVRTNAFVATRIQFPNDSSVLILTPDKTGATNRSIALILTANRK